MASLDCTLIRSNPTKIYVGEAPFRYGDLPRGVRVVMNFCGWCPSEMREHIVLALPLVDVDSPSSCPTLRDLYEFLEVAHVYAQSYDTYWHCQAGANRSVMMLAAYLYTYDDNYESMDQVIHALKELRGAFALNNTSFESFLRSLDRGN